MNYDTIKLFNLEDIVSLIQSLEVTKQDNVHYIYIAAAVIIDYLVLLGCARLYILLCL